MLARPELDLLDAAQDDPAAGGLVGVDGGEAATGGAVRGEPAAVGDQPEGRSAELAANPVEDDVRPGAPVARAT
jgi:hypothetical protein